MAYIELSSGGGTKLSKTLLWENPDPTTAVGNASITLSQPISNFKYLEIDFYKSTTVRDTLFTNIFPFSTDMFPLSSAQAAAPSIFHCIACAYSNYSVGTRKAFWFYDSYDKLRFASGIYGGSTTQTGNPMYANPVAIYGLK